MPPHFVKKMAEVVEEERTLTVGVFKEGIVFQEKVTIREKRIFTGELIEEPDEEFLFPELEHGMDVKLEGRLVRGNADTNSIGLDYRGHNLNCVPEHGSIVQYKEALTKAVDIRKKAERAYQAAATKAKRADLHPPNS